MALLRWYRVGLFLSFIFCFLFPSQTFASGYGQHNAMWIQSLFMRGYVPSTGKKLVRSDIDRLAERLRTTKIKYAYLFAGPFDSWGKLPDYATSALAQKNLARLHALAPDTLFLAWVGGIQYKEVFVSDPAWVQNAIESSANLLKKAGFDGVHVDFEYLLFGQAPDPALDYGAKFNHFMKRLRTRLPGTYLSTVVTSTAPEVRPWKYKSKWKEISELSHFVDQIGILFFDTHIRNQFTYEENLRVQVKDIGAWIEANRETKCEYLIGAGTFVNKEAFVREYRDMKIENLLNHLQTLRKVLDEEGGKKWVAGLAIFCDWETTGEEWRQLQQFWSLLPEPAETLPVSSLVKR